AMESLGLANLVGIGLAKKEELIFTRDHVDPIGLASDDPALLLLQRIRDEAHRFAITFHRTSRAKRTLTSELDAVPGLGPKRRRLLLQKFGSLAGVRRARREDLEAVVGAKVAEAVLRHFGAGPSSCWLQGAALSSYSGVLGRHRFHPATDWIRRARGLPELSRGRARVDRRPFG